MSDKASKKKGTSNEGSDDQYWRRDWQSPETDHLLHYIPYKSKSMSVNPDPWKFPFAIVCCHYDIYRNTLRGMRMHLDECPHRYWPRILCGHCELTESDCREMVKHLNVKGRLSDEPCDSEYKVVPLHTPTFPEKHMPQQTHTLQKLGKGVKSDNKTGQTSRKYNSWTTCESVSLDTLRREARALWKEKVRHRRAISASGSSPVELSPKYRYRDIVKTAIWAANIPTPSVHATSDILDDVEPDDPPPVDTISTSFVLSSPTPTVSLGLVASSIVIPFLSSPSPP